MSYYLQAQLAGTQKESGDQFNDVVSTDHLVNNSDAPETLWTCRRSSNIEQRLLVMLVDDEEVYNSDEYIF